MSRLSPMRPFFILAPLGVLYLALFGRLVNLHAYPKGGGNEHYVANHLLGLRDLPAERGAILAHDGTAMVYDRPGFRLVMDLLWKYRRYHPDHLSEEMTSAQVEQEIADLAQACKVDRSHLRKILLNPEVSYASVRRGIDPFEADKIKAYLAQVRGTGLYLRAEVNRVYPLGRIYSNLLGLTLNQNGLRKGVSGLERTCEDCLAGVNGSKGSQRVTSKFGINPACELSEPTCGTDVQTTLDVALGGFVRERLLESMEKYTPTWNGAVVINVKTGAILSLLGLPDFDPEDPYSDDQGLNHQGQMSNFHLAMENAVVPGSTFKPFVVGWAYDQGVISATDSFADPGTIRIPGRPNSVRNATGTQLGSKTPAECIVHSSNVVAIQIGQRLGVDRFRDMLEVFPLWDRVVLGGTKFSRGIPPSAHDWEFQNGREGRVWTLPSLSIGHDIMISPVRYVSCFASLINGGTRVDPYLLAENAPAAPGERLIRTETSDFLIDAMERMVKRREGRPLPKIEGLRWGGKSGTARNETNQDLNTTLFMAFGPIPDPEVLVLVVVQNPVAARVSGTRICGPVAGDILHYALSLRGLLPGQRNAGLDSVAQRGNLKRQNPEFR
jgi:cell division protein FtsI/penicillin-binding protein 2